MYHLKNLRTREIVLQAETLEELIYQNFYNFDINFYREDTHRKSNPDRVFTIRHRLFPDYFTVLDDADLTISRYQIEQAYFETKSRRDHDYYNRYFKPQNGFREGPVKYTGKRCYRGYYRRPKTTSERRVAALSEVDEDIQDYGIKLRQKRHHNNLPDTWDDNLRSCCHDRNWKRYRRHQWK